MPSIKYWQNLGFVLDTAKENIPIQCSIGDTCFTTLVNIEGNLYIRHTQNSNHVHKYSNDIISVIIIFVRDVHGGEIVFKNRMSMNDIGKRKNFLKHSHANCVVGAFDKTLQ